MSYLGQQLGQGQAERFVFTASGGETSVTTSDDGRAIAYTVGQVDVYLNGAKLINGSDFTATTGTSITGLAALTASDVVEVFALSIFQASDTVSAASGGTFNGNVTVDANLSVTGTADIDTSLNVDGTVTADGLTVVKTTNTPAQFESSGTTSAYLQMTNTGGGGFISTNNNDVVISTTGSADERMRIDSAGNVGIGDTSPSTYGKLVVAGSTPFAVVRSTDVTTVGFSMLVNSGSNGVGSIATDDGGHMTFDTGSTGAGQAERMRIDSSGNVGIGRTSSSVVRLSVAGTDATSSNYAFEATNNSSATRFIVRNDGQSQFFKSDNSASMTITSAGDVGIGTTPASGVRLDIRSNAAATLGDFRNASSTGFGLYVAAGDTDSQYAFRAADYQNNALVTITGAGNLLVGTTTANPTGLSNNTPGVELSNTGGLRSSVDDDVSGTFNRKTNEGPLLLLRVDGDTKGIVGIAGSRPYLSNRINFSVKIDDFANGSFIPADEDGAASDNVSDIGSASARWDDIYATNGTIQTSDANEKQDIAELDEAERRVAVACKGLLRKFRWIDSVEAKGDEARIHFGIIAQDLQAAFEAEGLDAGRYAMFIHSTWTDEETGEERSRMGVRYSELLAFIIAAL